MVLYSFVGCFGKSQESNGAQRVQVVKNEYKETDKILNYKYGIKESVKKKMILSEIARHYSMENDYPIDSIAPVIDISYEEKYSSFEVYYIRRIDPWVLDMEDLTDIEFLGQYIVAYNLPYEGKKTIQEIKQSGIITDCPYLRVHEALWVVLLSEDLRQYYVVKDVFSKEEGIETFKRNIESQRP